MYSSKEVLNYKILMGPSKNWWPFILYEQESIERKENSTPTINNFLLDLKKTLAEWAIPKGIQKSRFFVNTLVQNWTYRDKDNSEIVLLNEIMRLWSWILKTLLIQIYGVIWWYRVNDQNILIDGKRWNQTTIVRNIIQEDYKNTHQPKRIFFEETPAPKNKNSFYERRNKYEQDHTIMEDDIFDIQFNNNVFKQWPIGNCYFLAYLRSLMESENYKTLIKTSVQGPEQVINNDGSNGFLYRVKIPLWEPRAKTQTIYDTDLTYHWVSNSNRWAKVLESAYIKFITWEHTINTRSLRKANEWWKPNLAAATLLGNENIIKYSTWWYMNFAIADNQHILASITTLLLNWDKNNYMLCASSYCANNVDDSNTYTVPKFDKKNSFNYRHAYSITWIEKQWKNIISIQLINPHNTSKPFWINYNTFIYGFSWVHWWMINKWLAYDKKTTNNSLMPDDDKQT